ncbi:hypothetical protein ACQVP2_07670 [Methylobacterium aquaticum]|uniref:hypothetical protein n=1 Tax=Methylobacterium aquaticum TaxID=270351 RepID=UPI003D178AC9
MIAALAHAGFTGTDLVQFPDEAAPRIRASALYRETRAGFRDKVRAAIDADVLGPLVVGPRHGRGPGLTTDDVLLDIDQAVLLCALLGTARAVVVAERLMPLLPLPAAA